MPPVLVRPPVRPFVRLLVRPAAPLLHYTTSRTYTARSSEREGCGSQLCIAKRSIASILLCSISSAVSLAGKSEQAFVRWLWRGRRGVGGWTVWTATLQTVRGRKKVGRNPQNIEDLRFA